MLFSRKRKKEASQKEGQAGETAYRPKDEGGRVRYHICFYGRVQGVGFRYHAMQAAVQLGLTGWVRNVEEYVELEAQGEKEKIDRLVEKMRENSWIDIERVEFCLMPVKEGEEDFQITW